LNYCPLLRSQLVLLRKHWCVFLVNLPNVMEQGRATNVGHRAQISQSRAKSPQSIVVLGANDLMYRHLEPRANEPSAPTTPRWFALIRDWRGVPAASRESAPNTLRPRYLRIPRTPKQTQTPMELRESPT